MLFRSVSQSRYKMAKLILNSAELNLGGIWVAKNDGVINVNTLRLRPRTIIPANSVDDIKRLDMNTNVNLSIEMIRMYQAKIRSGMMSDQLTPINSSPLSATEVSARVNIIRNQLGSVFIRMQSEFLIGLLERVFDLLIREGLIQKPPQNLITNSGIINFTFTNPLSQSAKLESVTNTNNWLSSILPLVQYNPDILDVIDFDKVIYLLQDALSVNSNLVLTNEQVQAIREQKQQAQQQQQAFEQETKINALAQQEQDMISKETELQGASIK